MAACGFRCVSISAFNARFAGNPIAVSAETCSAGIADVSALSNVLTDGSAFVVGAASSSVVLCFLSAAYATATSASPSTTFASASESALRSCLSRRKSRTLTMEASLRLTSSRLISAIVLFTAIRILTSDVAAFSCCVVASRRCTIKRTRQ